MDTHFHYDGTYINSGETPSFGDVVRSGQTELVGQLEGSQPSDGLTFLRDMQADGIRNSMAHLRGAMFGEGFVMW